MPEVVSHEQWLAVKLRLLRQEKELTRRRDALNAERPRLPMVKVDKHYVFDGPDGPVSLAGLFGDWIQLVILSARDSRPEPGGSGVLKVEAWRFEGCADVILDPLSLRCRRVDPRYVRSPLTGSRADSRGSAPATSRVSARGRFAGRCSRASS